jgi:PKD repeat protein
MIFFFNHKEHNGIHKGQNVLLITLCSFLLFSLSPPLLFSQISQGGKPASFNYTLTSLKDIPQVVLSVPDMEAIRINDNEEEKFGSPRRVGIGIKAGIDVIRDGKYEVLPNGIHILRITVSCEDALALGLYFNDFHLTEGCSMYVYDYSHRSVLGAYTLYNNRQNRLFSAELIPGDRLVIEIDSYTNINDLSVCKISEISYVYRDFPEFIRNRGTSDDCEVNINCTEGDNWQYQKHGVAKIYVKQNSGFFWCTGSLLNNTLQNNDPFFLTADHCGPTATEEDLSQWIFYFNFEAPGCENPTENPPSNSMTGAIKLANANTNGSDFLLLRLADTIPLNYEPFYNGWSIENFASPQGVTIHHPSGDIKKISTYTFPIESSQWFSTPGTHWQVYWSPTANGWGVTEGGSSGSPLYDNTGRIIGTLTGGMASCEPDANGPGTGPDQPDYYGKFSYSWDQNGSEPSQQLKYWLDPINLGVTTLPGKYSTLTAAFQASETLILIGNTIEFTNLSSGLPVSWEWTFEGGIPGSFSGAQPGKVTYPEGGSYDVRLIVSNGTDYDTLLLKDFIQVVGKVFPNPTSDKVNIFLEEELPSSLKIEIFNIYGQKVHEEEIPGQLYEVISIDLSALSSGVYLIRIEVNQHYLFAKVMVKRSLQ